MIIEKIDEFEEIREKHKEEKIVFCSGVFDLTHLGHVSFFESCKKNGDVLIVAVGGDAFIKKRKGKTRPILNESIRLKTVDSLKPVDYTLLDDISDEHSPLEIIKIAFEKLKPNSYVIREDAFNIEERRKLCEKYDVDLIVIKNDPADKFNELSTTAIIDKIKGAFT